MPTPKHQHVSRLLANALEPAAEAAGLEVYEAINVRLRHCRIPIPDLVIIQPINPDDTVADSTAVRPVCEIVSRSNAAEDRVLKMQLYAEAGIRWYLLVEPGPAAVTVQLFRLEGSRYAQHAAGAPGTPLEMTDPIAVVIDPAQLMRRWWWPGAGADPVPAVTRCRR